MQTLGQNVQLKLGQGSFDNTITDGKIQDDTTHYKSIINLANQKKIIAKYLCKTSPSFQ